MIKIIILLHISLSQQTPEQQQWNEYKQALLQISVQDLVQYNQGKELWRQEQETERQNYHQPDHFERKFYP
jgi:hypothetical protein